MTEQIPTGQLSYYLAEQLKAPVGILSYGPMAVDKQWKI